MGWPRGEATACKAVYTGSNPVPTSHERAIGAAVARFPDTEEVTGSIPVSPTIQGPREISGPEVFPGTVQSGPAPSNRPVSQLSDFQHCALEDTWPCVPSFLHEEWPSRLSCNSKFRTLDDYMIALLRRFASTVRFGQSAVLDTCLLLKDA